MKRGQVSDKPFTWLLSILIISSIVLTGYYVITGFDDTSSDIKYRTFVQEFDSSLQRLSNQEQKQTSTFTVSKEYTEFCLVGDHGVPESFKKEKPLIAITAIETENNAFLITENDFDAFKLEHLDLLAPITCVPVKEGEFTLELEGTSTGASGSTKPNAETSSSIPLITTDEMIIHSLDSLVTIIIPPQTHITTPNGETDLIIKKIESPGEMSLSTFTYELLPHGTQFNKEIEIQMIYHPDSVSNITNLRIAKQEEGANTWDILLGGVSSDLVISGKTQSFSTTAGGEFPPCGMFRECDVSAVSGATQCQNDAGEAQWCCATYQEIDPLPVPHCNEKMDAEVEVCPGEDACTACVLRNRPDVIPFYENENWNTQCGFRDDVVDNWCIISPIECPCIKATVCHDVCQTVDQCVSDQLSKLVCGVSNDDWNTLYKGKPASTIWNEWLDSNNIDMTCS